MTDSEQTQTNESSTSSTTPSGHNTHTGMSATQHIGVMKIKPAIPDSDEELDRALHNDGFFPNTESYIVIGGWEAVNKLLLKDAETVKEYNIKLSEHGIDFAIRHKHEIKIRNVTYLYSGMYIFETVSETQMPEKPDFIAPRGPDIEGSTYCEICYKWVNDKQLGRHETSRIHKENIEKRNQKPKKITKIKYLKRFDPHEWRKLLGNENFKAVGIPPRLELPILKFRRIEHAQQVTNTIIIPYSMFMVSGMQRIFNGYPVFKLA